MKIPPAIALTLSLALLACSKPDVRILSPTLLDGAADGSACQVACEKRFLNGCAGDESRCEEVCANDQNLGAASQLDPACIVNAKTLPELQACDSSCKGPTAPGP